MAVTSLPHVNNGRKRRRESARTEWLVACHPSSDAIYPDRATARIVGQAFRRLFGFMPAIRPVTVDVRVLRVR
jgi:hypothetical protein